jgi:hypothetical protein
MAEGMFALAPVADTGDRFANFAPYVPSIELRGRVAFQASLRGGGSGVFLAARGSVVTDFALNPVSINGAGQFAFRLKLEDQKQLIVRADPAG